MHVCYNLLYINTFCPVCMYLYVCIYVCISYVNHIHHVCVCLFVGEYACMNVLMCMCRWMDVSSMYVCVHA